MPLASYLVFYLGKGFLCFWSLDLWELKNTAYNHIFTDLFNGSVSAKGQYIALRMMPLAQISHK